LYSLALCSPFLPAAAMWPRDSLPQLTASALSSRSQGSPSSFSQPVPAASSQEQPGTPPVLALADAMQSPASATKKTERSGK
ncbi:unnamed protein product, partial [Chrysoparadoxa australica]